MLKKVKGFTLIELLIVVAIIGILAALLVPNALTAIQKAKQKGTMMDIISIATGCADYVTDNEAAPDANTQTGALTAGCNFIKALSPFYMKVCPVTDSWGNALIVYSGSTCSTFAGVDAADVAGDDFIIQSYGRDKAVDSEFSYSKADPGAGLYRVSSLADFDNDLVNWNGSFIRAPRAGAAAGS